MLAKGNLYHLGDILMQRFKSVEQASGNAPGKIADQFEVVPVEAASSASQSEKECAQRVSGQMKKIDSAFQGV